MASREPAQRESFIVRVWWKPGQATHEVWVQHVRSGETAVVHGLTGIATFIERCIEKDLIVARHGLK